ncbi:ribosomal protection-like ABC-F family protein [Clostridium sp. 'White wine YQ']|uniref:ribosomal protection-like ABC-F family protein n=1 Tax=Clostridium sp. 'White wine YQ' TaxID=3027474 RepID=UPI0023652031|nr:ABC-F type ribosomal protection protein [Clostridium sp. 'White wine YQ']MDD7795290.1 ABC-F type ribosomal protection protein [Clostridium sp. 'White wine YQ']
MIEIALKELVKYYGANLVLESVSFEVHKGERIGLVGRNGSGKSTILEIISGHEEIDGGTLSIRKGAKVGYLKQIPNYPEEYTGRDALNTAFIEINKLETDITDLEEKMSNSSEKELEKVFKQYSEVQQKYETLGGYDKEEKLNKVSQGLKLSDDMLNKPFSILSGGEKTTVMLGKILLENPDILLLDEPTNHLDMESLEWLEGYIKQYSGTIIIVSHDRYFLDKVATSIVELEDNKSTAYQGNYSAYVKKKDEDLLLQYQAYSDQQKKIDQMEKSIKNLRDWAIRGDNGKFFRRAASMQKRLDKIDKVHKPNLNRKNIKLNLMLEERSGEEVIKVREARKTFGDKELFINGEFNVSYGEKVALIGANGCGKSTFLKILLGYEDIDSGIIKLGESVRATYLPQNIEFNNDNATILECFREDIQILEGKAREYLARFMFFGESVYKKVGSLSGGEKTRLMLSKLLFKDVNLLILDEPTNHLDIDSIETLEEALEDFQGTIFFISHDRYFINKIGSRIVELNDKKFISYEGNFDYYKIKKDENSIKVGQELIKKEESIKKPYRTKESTPSKRQIEELENNINEIEKEITDVDTRMSSLGSDYEELNKYLSIKEDLQEKLDTLLEKWVAINE